MTTIKRLERGPRFSRAVVHNGVAYFSGLTAANRDGDIRSQTLETLAKADELLAKLGTQRSSLLSATIWLRNMEDFAAMNEVWEKWIDPDHPPARATVQSNLAAGDVRVEIQFSAAVD